MSEENATDRTSMLSGLYIIRAALRLSRRWGRGGMPLSPMFQACILSLEDFSAVSLPTAILFLLVTMLQPQVSMQVASPVSTRVTGRAAGL
jgi:hypothetical protein